MVNEVSGNRITRLVMVVGVLLLGVLGLVAPTTAQIDDTPDVKFTAYPVGAYENRWFQVEVTAGDTATLTAGVANRGSAPVALRAFVASAVNPPNGGFSAGAEDDPLAGPALWVDSPAESFAIEPGTARQWDFTVTVPEGTPPGQYVAALVVSTEGDRVVPGSDVFTQVVRSAMSIEITVPGPMTPAFEFGPPTVATDVTGRSLEIPITNTGNVLVKPEGELRVTTPAGEVVSTSRIEMGSVYGGNTTSVRVSLPSQLPLGDFRVSLTLTDEATGASASVSDAPLTLF